MQILALSTKLNQILYTYSVGLRKARNAKTYHPKWLVALSIRSDGLFLIICQNGCFSPPLESNTSASNSYPGHLATL